MDGATLHSNLVNVSGFIGSGLCAILENCANLMLRQSLTYSCERYNSVNMLLIKDLGLQKKILHRNLFSQYIQYRNWQPKLELYRAIS
jgi:hypothetical protein